MGQGYRLVAAVAVLSAVGRADRGRTDGPACRCRPPDKCFASVPWADLNRTVAGRLVPVADEFSPCFGVGIATEGCSAVLNQTDHEFFYTGQPGGYLHTGLADSWNISHPLATVAVAAETASDIQAAISFAAQYNLRLAVKGTGHDWFGRSGSHPSFEGALLVWTHRMKNITWHDSGFVPQGCNASSRVFHAVTVQAGTQFADIYPTAEKRGMFYNGGTCTSVGVVGCMLGGCFGSFSQLLGSSASNLLEATLVTADGQMLKVSKCSHADLFWAIRGGGAGFAVVVDLTFRTYPTPQYLTSVSYTGYVGTSDPLVLQTVAVEVLRTIDGVAEAHQGWNGGWSVPFPEDKSFSISLSTYEGNRSAGEILLSGLADWVIAQDPSRKITGKLHSSIRNRPAGGWASPGAPENQVSLPWDDPHHDTEIGTEHLVSMSKWITRTALHEGPGDTGLENIAKVLINISSMARSGLLAGLPGHVGIDMMKAQGGATKETTALFLETAQNPVLLDTIGFITSQWRIPSIPQLPPSSTVLRTLWPRLRSYAITSTSDPLYPVCEKGASGDEAAAAQCMNGWASQVPRIVNALTALKSELWRNFQPEQNGNAGYSGSYWNEADFFEPQWQQSFWGNDTYQKLLQVKKKYDQNGLFVCHHCVGSEAWDATGNCRL